MSTPMRGISHEFDQRSPDQRVRLGIEVSVVLESDRTPFGLFGKHGAELERAGAGIDPPQDETPDDQRGAIEDEPAERTVFIPNRSTPHASASDRQEGQDSPHRGVVKLSRRYLS